MGSRVPVQHFNLRSADAYIDGESMHDLNSVDHHSGEIIEPLVDRDSVNNESLGNEQHWRRC